MKEFSLSPYDNIHKRDELKIKVCKRYVYFEALIDGAGNSFRIEKELIKARLI